MVKWSEFKEVRVPVKSDLIEEGVEIYAKVGGQGPGLLLIHGYPQTHQSVPTAVHDLSEGTWLNLPLALSYTRELRTCNIRTVRLMSQHLAICGRTTFRAIYRRLRGPKR
jgi:hypothetical protein